MSANDWPIPTDFPTVLNNIMKRLDRLERRPTGSTSAVITGDGAPARVFAEQGVVPTQPPEKPVIQTVQGNDTGLTVVIAPIQPSTFLDFYINGVLVAQDERTNIINLNFTDMAGTAMVADTDYTVTVQSKNAAGLGPFSDPATARLNPSVSATQVIAILQAGFILTGGIQVGSSMVLDPSGLTITQTDGRQTYLKSDGSGNQFVGQATLDSTTVLGALTVLGSDNFLNGLLNLGTGVGNPTGKPGVTTDYTSVTVSGTRYRMRGLFSVSTSWATTDYYAGTGQVQAFLKSTGASSGFFYLPANWDPAGGVATLGSTYYVLGKDYSSFGGGDWFVKAYTNTGVLLNTWLPSASPSDNLALGADGTNLLIAKITAAGNLYVSTYNTTGTELSFVSCGTSSGWTASSLPTSVLKVAVDTATVRYVVAFTDKIVVLNTSTGVRVNTEEWMPANSPIGGLGWDGTNFYTVDTSRVWKYTNLIGTWDFAFTWLDDQTGQTGYPTLAQTQLSTLRTFAPTKRARWTISLPSAPPDDGTANGANTAALYAAPFGSGQIQQAVLPEGTLSQAFSTLALTGTSPPGSNGFASRPGAMGRIKSGTGVIDLMGDSSGKVGPWSWDSTGVGTQDNIMVAASSNAVATSTTNVTIAGLSATVTSPGTGAVWMVGLAADVLIGATAGGNIVGLLVDGTEQAALIVSAGQPSGRFAASKRFRITGLSAGSHTFTARTRSQGSYTTTVNATFSTMTVERVA